ncbi:hypothetical protein ACWCV9_36545 [Streptomyces sp. NPDC001606]
MMIKFTFVPETMKEPTSKELAKLARASEMDLRYDYFPVTVGICTHAFGEEVLPGTPAIDFAFCLLSAAKEIQKGNPGRVSFTENDLLIHFVPDGEKVVMERSWDPVRAACNLHELSAAVSGFCYGILEFITQRYPDFQQNPACSKLTAMLNELP